MSKNYNPTTEAPLVNQVPPVQPVMVTTPLANDVPQVKDSIYHTSPSENTNVYENENFGECMVAFTYEKLLFHYWNLNADTYQSLKKDDEKLSLPEKFRYDWNAFKELYFETFNEKLGQKYEIICSSGMKRI